MFNVSVKHMIMATWKTFEDIEAWQLSRAYSKKLYAILRSNKPLETDYKLSGQMKGSSGSIMDNIAEGFERGSNAEFRTFLGYSKGSAGEQRSQVYRALDADYLKKETADELITDLKRISGKLQRMISYLNSSTHKGTRFKTPNSD